MFIYQRATSTPKVTPTLRGQDNPPQKKKHMIHVTLGSGLLYKLVSKMSHK